MNQTDHESFNDLIALDHLSLRLLGTLVVTRRHITQVSAPALQLPH